MMTAYPPITTTTGEQAADRQRREFSRNSVPLWTGGFVRDSRTDTSTIARVQCH